MDTATAEYTLIKRIKDEKFSVDNLHQYALCLQVGIRDFQVCVIDSQSNRIVLFEDFRLENVKTVNTRLKALRIIFDNHHVLKAGFWSSIKISIKTHKFTLVPVNHFVAESASDYLAVNSEIKTKIEQVAIYRHLSSDAINIYACDKRLMAWLKSVYPNIKIQFTHQGSAFIEGIFRHDDHPHDKTMYCLVDRGILHVVVNDRQKLVYYNQFAVRKSDEYLKYIMLVFKELRLNPKTSNVIVWGTLKPQSKHINLLKKYIRNIAYGSRPKYLKYSFQFDEIADHQYFDAFSIYLCD